MLHVKCIVLCTRCITRASIERQYAALQNVGPSPGYYNGFMATTVCAAVVITIIIITIIVRNGNNNIIELRNGNGVGRSKNGGLTAARETRQKKRSDRKCICRNIRALVDPKETKGTSALPRLSLFFYHIPTEIQIFIAIFLSIIFLFLVFFVFCLDSGVLNTLGHTRFCVRWLSYHPSTHV